MSRTIEQQIADQEAKLARLKEKKRKERDGQLYVIGGALLKAAREDESYQRALTALLRNHVTRAEDVKRIKPLLDEFTPEEKPTPDTPD